MEKRTGSGWQARRHGRTKEERVQCPPLSLQAAGRRDPPGCDPLTLFFSLHHFLSPMPSSAPALAMALEALAVKQQLLAAALERAALAEAALERATRAGV